MVYCRGVEVWRCGRVSRVEVWRCACVWRCGWCTVEVWRCGWRGGVSRVEVRKCGWSGGVKVREFMCEHVCASVRASTYAHVRV